ncbi:MAG: hypothetical protein WD273_11345 [Trueperaceae bacterium]
MTWLDKHLKMINHPHESVIIQAGPEFGTFELLSELGSAACPLLWLDFPGGEGFDSIEQGIRLSDAIRKTFGSPLFGYGIPVDHGLALLQRHSALLGPFIVAVSGASAVPELIEKLWTLTSGSVRLVLVEPGDTAQSEAPSGISPILITANDLRLTLEEAREFSGPSVSSSVLDQLLESSRGALVQFLFELYAWQGLPRYRGPSLKASSDAVLTDSLTNEEVLEILVHRGKWMEALELAVHSCPERVQGIVEKAGDLFFDRGLFDGLWRLLSRVPQPYKRSEKVLYWSFSAAIAVGKQKEIIAEVEDFLRDQEAGELRALYAASGLALNPLTEAERAYRTKRSGLTANFYGFVLATHSDPVAAIPFLEEALDLFEKRGNHHRVVSTAISICDAYINLGNYSKAASWAAWALKEFATRDLREELLRYHATALLAYVKLLLGELETGSSLLEPIQLAEEIYGIPSMEAVISTMGDYALVCGNAEVALGFYELVFEQFGRRLGPYAVNDMVRALLYLDENDRAVHLASEAVALSSGSNDYEKQRALLALGTATSAIQSDNALPILEAVLGHYEHALNAPALAQSGIHLAKAYVKQGDNSAARAALSRAAPGLRELAKPGWLLLGGPEDEIQAVWDLWNEDSTPLELRFLGGRKIRVQHRTRDYPMRWCEILAVLAFHPEGLNGERLSFLLHGDDGNMSTLKSNVSRMRQDVPVSSRPYQIQLPHTADFVELDRALREGRVREALELYHGPLLPESNAPFVVELRDYLEETLRQAALTSGDVEVLLSLARKLGDDLELWEATSQKLSQNDPLLPLAKAHVKRIQRSWGG